MNDVAHCTFIHHLRVTLSLAFVIAAAVHAAFGAQPRGGAGDPEDRESSLVNMDAPTTQPSANPTPAWSATLTAFANALHDNAAVDADPIFAHLVPADSSVREFNKTQRSSLQALRSKSAGQTLLATRAYSATPQTLAGDIALDVKDAPLPAIAKRRLTPPDATDLKRANSVAAKWIANSLLTTGNDPIGVIVFWPNEASASEETETKTDDDSAREPSAASEDTTTAQSQPMLRQVPLFILVRGELVDGKYVIRQICYGNPIMVASGG